MEENYAIIALRFSAREEIMSKEEIRGLIVEVFDERINSALARLSNERQARDTKKDLETKEGSLEREILQKRIDRIDFLFEILQNLKQI